MNQKNKILLSVMMFLQFFIWGAWFVTMGTYLANTLKADGGQTAMAYSTQSWGAIIAPFFIGLIADKYINAERMLGILHWIGAILMFKLVNAADFTTFYPYILGYMIVYMPTLALVNSVAFNQMKDPAKEFSFVRVWGTIGWIAAGLMISFIFHWDAAEAISAGSLKNTFMMGALASAALGLMAFILPKTPPKGDNTLSIKDILGLDALALLANRNFLIFFICSILICIPLAFYYQCANSFLSEIGSSNPAGRMAMGQVSEVAFLLLLPFFFKKFGFKKTILVGMLAWSLRYILFAYGNADSLSSFLLLGILLHGICYDFFFVSGQIYTDTKAGEKIKSAAQGMITLATYGIGMLIGFYIAGKVVDANLMTDGKHIWTSIWKIPAGIALVVFLLFAFFFKEEKVEYKG